MTCGVTGNSIPANKCASTMNGMPGCPQPLCVPEVGVICGKIRCQVGEECCMKCNSMGQIVPAEKCALKNQCTQAQCPPTGRFFLLSKCLKIQNNT